MINTSRITTVFLLCLILSTQSLAVEKLTSSYFPNEHPEIIGDWLHSLNSAGENAGNLLFASLPQTELRLHIPTTFINKPVRIYFVLPSQIPGLTGLNGLEVKWHTQGTFLSGSSFPGDRSLFFEGEIKNALLSDVISFEFTYDARFTTEVLIFEPVYEIEEK